MLPLSAFPNTLPLSRAAALDVLDRLEMFDDAKSNFLSFMMIPVEERMGEWRFAGSSESLADAFRRICDFGEEIGLAKQSGVIFLRELLESPVIEIWTDPKQAPIDKLGLHRVILCGEGQEPYDDIGFCVLEVTSLQGSGFENRLPETTPPEEWDYED